MGHIAKALKRLGLLITLSSAPSAKDSVYQPMIGEAIKNMTP
ncbi:hypothetical protein [Marinicella rhabdoformis]|nr:hypothetical protein [Marinicella rhabdoformis]